MHRRILFGVTAWLLGAATATAGSLLAVSLLGQGITGSSGTLLTQDAVHRALASEAAEASSDSPAPATAGTPARPSAAASRPAAGGTAPASPAPPPGPGPSVTATTAAPPASGNGTVLTSAGGEVVATCQGAGAYLISWSPLQGYETGGVARGPAATPRVTFDSNANRVTMVVSCSSGVPSATSYTRSGDE